MDLGAFRVHVQYIVSYRQGLSVRRDTLDALLAYLCQYFLDHPFQ